MITWYDLSPMRPDAYKQQDAERWTEALQMRNALLDGRESARAEKDANDQLSQTPDMKP